MYKDKYLEYFDVDWPHITILLWKRSTDMSDMWPRYETDKIAEFCQEKT